jgi:hypothetical protein
MNSCPKKTGIPSSIAKIPSKEAEKRIPSTNALQLRKDSFQLSNDPPKMQVLFQQSRNFY